jgi:hypothetical protein
MGTAVMDTAGTSHYPDGPWPRHDHNLLAAWIKLQTLEYECVAHEARVDKIPDNVYHGKMLPMLPFDVGATEVSVDDATRVDMRGASELHPYVLSVTPHGEAPPGPIQPYRALRVTGRVTGDPNTLRVEPTSFAGAIRDELAPVQAHMTQGTEGNQPQYRRNVENFMPSITYEPPSFMVFQDHSVLSRRLSGPVDDVDFTLFFVARA